MEKTIHQGRNIKRFREMFGIKQEVLALELGDDWNQKKISLLEAKEVVERSLLEEIGKALKLPAEVFENFTDEAALTVISNTFSGEHAMLGINNSPTYNTDPKLADAIEENKKLGAENKQLYQALLKEKDEKIALLERLLEKK